MKVVFCTNIWNHHQGPVAMELAKLLGDDFKLLLHQPLDHRYSLERIKMGWNLVPPMEKWVVGPPKTYAVAGYSEYVRMAMAADVLLMDGIPPYIDFRMLNARKDKGKINIIMGERLFKRKIPWWYRLSLRKVVARYIVHHNYESANIYFLTMSHWCVEDLRYYGVCNGRIYRWGYLTPTSLKCIVKPKRDKVRIGWCGRMLSCKQVDLIVKAYAMMPEAAQMVSELYLVGNGDMEDTLKSLVKQLRVSNHVHFRPMMSQPEAMSFMRDLDIYVFPSNRVEGWGAALLEAMDKGCAVIANEAAGSTLEVVEDGLNGFVVRDGDVTGIARRMKELVMNPKLRVQFGKAAWKSLQDWSPVNGAIRLSQLARALHLGNASLIPDSGLCSRVG